MQLMHLSVSTLCCRWRLYVHHCRIHSHYCKTGQDWMKLQDEQ